MAVPVDIAKMVTGYADGVICLSDLPYLNPVFLGWESVILWTSWHRKMTLIYLTTLMLIVNTDISVYFKGDQ